MTSGCETPSAGQCSTAERVGPPAPPTSPSFSGSDQLLNSGAVRPTGLTDRAQRGRATCDRGRRRGGDGSPAARIAVRQCGQLVGEVGERCGAGLVVDVAPALDAGDQGRPVQDLQVVADHGLGEPGGGGDVPDAGRLGRGGEHDGEQPEHLPEPATHAEEPFVGGRRALPRPAVLLDVDVRQQVADLGCPNTTSTVARGRQQDLRPARRRGHGADTPGRCGGLPSPARPGAAIHLRDDRR